MQTHQAERRTILTGLAAATAGLAAPGLAHAQPPVISAPEPAALEPVIRVTGELPVVALRTWTDPLGRPATDVHVNGQGPFRFLADTGSNTSVITRDLARKLGLAAAGQVDVLGVTGMVRADSLRLASIRSGAAMRENMRVVMLGGDALAGLDGILGMDMFAGRRLRFNFLTHAVEIEEAARRRPLPVDMAVQLRHGLLVETEGRLSGIRARCVVDTGSEHTLINRILMEQLLDPARRSRFREPVEVMAATSVTGEGVWVRLPRLSALGMEVRNLIAVGIDAPVFHEWELAGTPTMLVGMDLLKGLKTLQIDYRRRRLQLELRDTTARA
ncbi:MAG: aspartyl protease family protein [Hyphomonadaceae bacterium]|nr:aspartyl protease family protein [Hyphomonadaceae bacterium]